MLRLDRLVGQRPMSVSVAGGTTPLYSLRGAVPRTPASNEKLVLSMTLLSRFGPRYRIPTTLEGRSIDHGTVPGPLWLVGHGDPEVGPRTLRTLARAARMRGVRRVQGPVVGVTSTFTRERWAPGWTRIALLFIGLPTALTFDSPESVSVCDTRTGRELCALAVPNSYLLNAAFHSDGHVLTVSSSEPAAKSVPM